MNKLLPHFNMADVQASNEPPRIPCMLSKAQVKEERAVRTISRSAFDAHTDPIFKSLKLLKFENIVSLQVAKIMYLNKNGQLPESFKNMFFTGQEIHNYNTRNISFFRLPSCRTNVRKFSLQFQGPKIFNSINDKINLLIVCLETNGRHLKT